jgi:hypothetical protein
MPVERYKVGRAYTRRERVVITNPLTPEDTKALNLPTESIHQPGPAYLWRIEPWLEWARWMLKGKGLPPDASAPIYFDKEWRRKNKRRSAAWYAVRMLLTARDLGLFVDRGDAAMAANLALDFGELTTEVRVIEYKARNAAAGGKGKAAERHADVEQMRDEWRRAAAEIWSRHPTWSATAVAGRIDPGRVRTGRDTIAKLKPRRTDR